MSGEEGPSGAMILPIQTFKDQFGNPTELLQRKSPGGINSFFISRSINREKFGVTQTLSGILKKSSSAAGSEHLQRLTLRDKGEGPLVAIFDFDFKDLSTLQTFCRKKGLRFEDSQLLFILRAGAMAGAALQDRMAAHPSISRKALKVQLIEDPQAKISGKKVRFSIRLSNPLAHDIFLSAHLAELNRLFTTIGESWAENPDLWNTFKRKKILQTSEQDSDRNLNTLRTYHETINTRSRMGVRRLLMIVAALASDTDLEELDVERSQTEQKTLARKMIEKATCSSELSRFLGILLLEHDENSLPTFVEFRAVFLGKQDPEELGTLAGMEGVDLLKKDEVTLKFDLQEMFEGKIGEGADDKKNKKA